MGLKSRIQSAWQGRISGCMLGKPLEILSFREGPAAVSGYLERVAARPLRAYVPDDGSDRDVASMRACCRGNIVRAEPDDDIHYTVLALMMLEEHGSDLSTVDVARTWLRHLPAASVYTAERAAYRTLLARGKEGFPERGDPGFDLAECSANPYSDWIGAQIRADLYGWVNPGRPQAAAHLASQDAQLSHRGDGVAGALFVAAAGALIPVCDSVEEAIRAALDHVPPGSRVHEAVKTGLAAVGDAAGHHAILAHYDGLSPVHALNNLALVVWALVSHPDDFGAAIGDVVAAGLDTDCNGATVGGLWGLQDKPIPCEWTDPWQGRVGLNLAGQQEVTLDDLVTRTASLCAVT